MTMVAPTPTPAVSRSSSAYEQRGDSGTPQLDREMVRRWLAFDADASELPEPTWGPIGHEVYARTYSRIKDDGTNEVWAETARRVVLGNLGYAPRETHLPDEAVELFELIYTFGAVPAGRHLWVTGTNMVWNRNCWSAPWAARTSEHFRFGASRLFEGGGVGSNYSRDLIALTRPVVGTLDVTISIDAAHPDAADVAACAGELLSASDSDSDSVVDCGGAGHSGKGEVYAVEDCREAWVDVWCHLIDLACEPGTHRLHIDLSQIRAHGEPLKTFGGRASGPAPLAGAIRAITAILNGAATSGHEPRRLSGLEAMAIDHEIAASVVAGGARRSARLSLMNWTDPEVFDFISCKSDSQSHWSTNISVEIDHGFRVALEDPRHPLHAQAERVLAAVTAGMAANGEPGFLDTDAHSVGEKNRIRVANPCGEASLEIEAGDPDNGIPAAGESCNLGSVDLARFGTDIAGATRAFELMARFLYRATLKPYPAPGAARIEERNRRIGVGFMGLQGWVAAHDHKLSELYGDQEMRRALSGFRLAIRRAADQLADQLGLPRSVKVTALAPTGSIAQLGGTTPGIHPVFARYFIRRVRYTDTDPGLADLARQGYLIVDDVYADNTKVVEFPVRDAILDRYPEHLIEQSNEMGFASFMHLVAAVQQSFCGDGDGQAVSATGQLPADSDPAELAQAIRPLLGQVKGITAFPDKSFALPPYSPIDRDGYERALKDLDESARFMAALGDSNSGECVGGACPVK